MTAGGFSPGKAARRVLRLAATGVLATLDAEGGPFASLVTVATTPDGEPILLLSKLAVHTQYLTREPKASLLLTGTGGDDGDPLASPRLSLTGRIGGDQDPMLRRRFLARHEEASGYADFADFGFHRFSVDGGHLVAGFGRIADLGRSEILTQSDDAAELIAAEQDAIAHMNGDHADALRLYATRLLGLADGEWRMTGVDPGGIDTRCGMMRARFDFAERVTTAAGLRKTLADFAEAARNG